MSLLLVPVGLTALVALSMLADFLERRVPILLVAPRGPDLPAVRH